jgi:hypothetical protein
MGIIKYRMDVSGTFQLNPMGDLISAEVDSVGRYQWLLSLIIILSLFFQIIMVRPYSVLERVEEKRKFYTVHLAGGLSFTSYFLAEPDSTGYPI